MRDPATMSPDERRTEVVQILVRGILRSRGGKRPDPSPARESAAGSSVLPIPRSQFPRTSPLPEFASPHGAFNHPSRLTFRTTRASIAPQVDSSQEGAE
jgi:hypothetical protein